MPLVYYYKWYIWYLYTIKIDSLLSLQIRSKQTLETNSSAKPHSKAHIKIDMKMITHISISVT